MTYFILCYIRHGTTMGSIYAGRRPVPADGYSFTPKANREAKKRFKKSSRSFWGSRDKNKFAIQYKNHAGAMLR